MTRTLCARQPVTMGESISTRLRASAGRLQAASSARKPPSEWPTRCTASPGACAAMKSSSWSRSRGQLLVTG